MRICTPHCGIAPESRLGGEVYERDLLRGLAEKGVDVHILLAEGKPYERGVSGWTVHPVRPRRGLRWYVTPFVFPPYIDGVYRQHRYDLLRAHSTRYVGPAALLARRLYHLPVPVVTHHHHLDPSVLNGVVDRRVIEGSDHVIMDSEFAKRQAVAELGVSAENVSVVYNGVGPKYVPTERRADLARKWGVEGKRVLLTAGSFIPRKNQAFLIDALASVRSRVGDVVLMFVGDGPLRETLARRAAERGVREAVVFTGYIPEADKVDTLALADVFVFASLLEGFGLAPLEAMGCGKPVVALRCASLIESVDDGGSGFLVDAGDTGRFAERVGLLLEDRDRCRRFGLAAASRVDKLFRLEHMTGRVLRIYEDVVREYRDRARVPEKRAA